MGYKPKSLEFGGVAGDENCPISIANVRVANGGSQNMLSSIFTNGNVFSTHGITFDIDKATIKPESMGVLNQVAGYLKQNASIKMEIDGHTDNSGNAAHNMTLSQQRSEAVKVQLVNMGIEASSLTTRGFGDAKPISDNITPEGKANNRRVEFIKK
jgi:OOP family OmpA-OmpF porin